MNKNVKIAKELVRLAKRLVSKSSYLFPDLHDVEVNYCSMRPCFDRMSFESDYERIGDYKDNGIYLYDKVAGNDARIGHACSDCGECNGSCANG